MSTVISTQTAPDAELAAFVSPHFLLRVAGLPIELVNALRFDATLDWARQVMRLDERVREGREELVEVLHGGVQTYASDREIQRALLALKRDLFNGRAPKDEGKARFAVSHLPPPQRAALDEWLTNVVAREQLLVSGRALFEQEVAQKRVLLKAALRDPNFRSGLLLASPTLERGLNHYLDAPNCNLNRRQRLAERAALLYLLRTACKTSPFSTLTAVAGGSFVHAPAANAAGVAWRADDMQQKSLVKLNVAILTRLSILLLLSGDVQGDLPVRVKTGWEIQGNRIRYLRRMITTALEESAQTLDSVKEAVFYLPLSPTLRRLLEVLADGREATLNQLADEIGRLEEADSEEKRAREFLLHLLRLDLLEVRGLRPSIYSPNSLAEYCARLEEIDNPKTRLLAAHLRKVEALVAAYPAAGLDERRRILAAVEDEVKACFFTLGVKESEIPRTILYEDAAIEPQELTISGDAWRDRLEKLATFQRLLPLFDVTVGSRLVTKGFFKVIYGECQRCDDVLAFAETFTRDYYDQYTRGSMRKGQTDAEGRLVASVNHFNMPEITRFDEVHQALVDYIGEEWAQMQPGSQELRLSEPALRALGERMPANLRTLYSHSFFSQLAETADGPLLVVNRVYSGLTQMFSRFIYMFDAEGRNRMAEGLRATLETIQPPGAIFAEIQGAYDTNMNLHPPVTRYEIVCPGEHSPRSVEDQIQVQDLYIEHDRLTDTLRLRSKRLDKEIIPLYLGFLLHMALPQLQQVLLNFSYPNFSALSFWTTANGPAPSDSVRFYPRIRYADIILERAMWKVPIESFPKREVMQPDADYFLNVVRWQRQHGIPVRIFVAPDFATARPAVDAEDDKETTGDRETGADTLIRKPLYVDFDNFFTVALLERAAARTSTGLVLTEMLPSEEQLWLRHDGQSYVTEFIFEVNQTSEGHRGKYRR